MSTFLLRFTLISMIMLLASPAFAAPGDREFKQGIAAFKARHYQQAITAFEKAQQKGKKSSALTYNLGVSYYKTAQYAKAKQRFSQLLNNRQFRQLAQYNLGLSYENGIGTEINMKQAKYWYQKSADQKFAAALNRLKTLN